LKERKRWSKPIHLKSVHLMNRMKRLRRRKAQNFRIAAELAMRKKGKMKIELILKNKQFKLELLKLLCTNISHNYSAKCGCKKADYFVHKTINKYLARRCRNRRTHYCRSGIRRLSYHFIVEYTFRRHYIFKK
ncbi:hypothetical protein L9F63_006786, partial [Diploptera punctata]